MQVMVKTYSLMIRNTCFPHQIQDISKKPISGLFVFECYTLSKKKLGFLGLKVKVGVQRRKAGLVQL